MQKEGKGTRKNDKEKGDGEGGKRDLKVDRRHKTNKKNKNTYCVTVKLRNVY